MSIWFHKNIELRQLKDFIKDTMADFLGIEWTEIGDNFLEISMPVNEKTRQPYGILHGGASCVLAETVGSVASALVIDMDKFYCVGLEINANHVKRVTEGLITAKCLPLHLGKHTHVWDIKIYDSIKKLICVSRLTVAIIPKK
jgi:1,4-dihydroxy-2-naphthoyl-CoA hydrolase